MVLRYKGTYISCIVQESSSLETRTRSDLNVRRKLKRGVLSTIREGCLVQIGSKWGRLIKGRRLFELGGRLIEYVRYYKKGRRNANLECVMRTRPGPSKLETRNRYYLRERGLNT